MTSHTTTQTVTPRNREGNALPAAPIVASEHPTRQLPIGKELPALPEGPHPVPAKSAAPAHDPIKHSWLGWIIALIFLGATIYGVYWFITTRGQGAGAATQPAAKPDRPVPVLAATASLGDMPLYLDAVGSAQALNTVTLRSRVDGQLVAVKFTEGQDVKQGDLLLQIDPAPFATMVAQATAQKAKDQAALDNAKRDLSRYETAREAVPQQQLDTAAAQVEQSDAAVKIDQSQIDSANLQLAFTRITAPISGRIGLRMVDIGNMIHATDPNGLAVITQLQPITVVFTLAEESLPQVQKAMAGPGKVKVLAFDSTFKSQIAVGELSALDNQIDTTSGTFKGKATFANQSYELYPNQFVNVRVLVDTRKSVVLVPLQAIQRSPQGTYVDVISDDNTVEQRTVTPGPTEASQTLVESGLTAGEKIAIEGLDQLKDGSRVTLQSSERGSRGNTTGPDATSGPATRGRRGGGGRGGSGRGAAPTTTTSPAVGVQP